MKRETVAAVISEIANELQTEQGYRFGHSELQRKLDKLEAEDVVLEVDQVEFELLLSAELLEANGYDELPVEIQPQMVRNAWELGETRANLLLQAALSNFQPYLHLTGTLDARCYELADIHAQTLVDLLKHRRAILDARLEQPHAEA